MKLAGGQCGWRLPKEGRTELDPQGRQSLGSIGSF